MPPEYVLSTADTDHYYRTAVSIRIFDKAQFRFGDAEHFTDASIGDLDDHGITHGRMAMLRITLAGDDADGDRNMVRRLMYVASTSHFGDGRIIYRGFVDIGERSLDTLQLEEWITYLPDGNGDG